MKTHLRGNKTGKTLCGRTAANYKELEIGSDDFENVEVDVCGSCLNLENESWRDSMVEMFANGGSDDEREMMDDLNLPFGEEDWR